MITQPQQKPLNWHMIGIVAGLLMALVPLYFTHVYFSRQAPLFDELLLGARVSADAVAGLIAIPDLFQKYGVQRPFFSILIDVGFTYLTGWNLGWMQYFNVLLTVVWWAGFVLLIRRWNAAISGTFALLAGLSIFSLANQDLWIITSNNGWLLAWIFFVLALWIGLGGTPGWVRLAAMAACAVCAALCVPSGLVVWVVLLLVMFMAGWRDWRMLTTWMILTCLFAGLYLSPLAAGPNLSAQVAPAYYAEGPQKALERPAETIYFALAVLGSPISPGAIGGPLGPSKAASGLMGLVMFGLLGWHTIKRQWLRLKEAALPAGLLLYGAASAALISLGRAGIEQASIIRYANTALGLWLGLSLLALTVLLRGRQATETRWLNYAAMLAVSAFGVVSPAANAFFAGLYLATVPPPIFRERDDCLAALPVIERDTCHYENDGPPLSALNPDGVTQGSWIQYEYLYRLAAYRLGIYRQVEPRLILPDYQPGDVVLIISPNIWANLTFREWLLAGVPESDILHAAAPGTWTSGDTFDPPPDDVWQAITAQNVREISARLGERAWIIAATRSQQQTDLLLQAVEQGGGQVMPLPVEQHAVYALYMIQQP